MHPNAPKLTALLLMLPLVVPSGQTLGFSEKIEKRTTKPEMVRIKGGTYQMGGIFYEGEADEVVHEVTVPDFYIGRYEVTFEEFDAFCEAEGRPLPDDSDWGRDKRPAVFVSWYDAVEYCNWKSRQDGLTPVYIINKNREDLNNQSDYDDLKWLVTADWEADGYRLPTEAEWEYAARQGGQYLRFGNGKDMADPGEINFDASRKYKTSYSVSGTYRKQTVPVGSFDPNAFGLYDMSGNVWEWCWDWYGADYYAESHGAVHPKGALRGTDRVLRGGSWDCIPTFLRVAYRVSYHATYRNDYNGFRLCRTAK